MTRKVRVELTAAEALAAGSALSAELERQRVDPSRTAAEVAAIRRAMFKLFSREDR